MIVMVVFYFFSIDRREDSFGISCCYCKGYEEEEYIYVQESLNGSGRLGR